jgi:hypothetical protein
LRDKPKEENLLNGIELIKIELAELDNAVKISLAEPFVQS